MPVGKVFLVGAGPGDPGLLTIKGKKAVESADVVLYDRLVPEEILAMLPPGARRIDVGKHSGNHPVPQEEINAILLNEAESGETVVRLKGGDPYVFGRGAEELAALSDADIPFEVIPGVSAATAVPAYAGIPVTHRDFASSMHIVTAHAKAGAKPEINYTSLVALKGTLVFMMGVTALPEISQGLLDAGAPPDLPAALVENGTTARQRKILSTISALPGLAAEQNIRPPAIMVVGEVCALSEKLDWFSRLPLAGMSVLVTNPKESGIVLGEKLRKLGCDVTRYPCVEIKPLEVPDVLFDRLRGYGWIVFTSAVGARLFFDGLLPGRDIRTLVGIKFAAVGSETAKEIAKHGLRVDFVPEIYDAKQLAIGLLRVSLPGERLLLFRAKTGAEELPRILAEHGFLFDDIAAYETVCRDVKDSRLQEALAANRYDLVAFTSASAVTGFAQTANGVDFTKINSVCIGGKTSEKAREYGMNASVSESAAMDGIVDLILKIRGKNI